MKYPEYKTGAKWRVDTNDNPHTLIIIGKGTKAGHKLCRVEFDKQENGNINFEAEFSHTYLIIHAKYQKGL